MIQVSEIGLAASTGSQEVTELSNAIDLSVIRSGPDFPVVYKLLLHVSCFWIHVTLASRLEDISRGFWEVSHLLPGDSSWRP